MYRMHHDYPTTQGYDDRLQRLIQLQNCFQQKPFTIFIEQDIKKNIQLSGLAGIQQTLFVTQYCLNFLSNHDYENAIAIFGCFSEDIKKQKKEELISFQMCLQKVIVSYLERQISLTYCQQEQAILKEKFRMSQLKCQAKDEYIQQLLSEIQQKEKKKIKNDLHFNGNGNIKNKYSIVPKFNLAISIMDKPTQSNIQQHNCQNSNIKQQSDQVAKCYKANPLNLSCVWQQSLTIGNQGKQFPLYLPKKSDQVSKCLKGKPLKLGYECHEHLRIENQGQNKQRRNSDNFISKLKKISKQVTFLKLKWQQMSYQLEKEKQIFNQEIINFNQVMSRIVSEVKQLSQQSTEPLNLSDEFPLFYGYIFNNFQEISQCQEIPNIPQIYYSQSKIRQKYRSQIQQMEQAFKLKMKLIQIIQKNTQKRVNATKLIFHSDIMSNKNPHKYIDNRPNYLVLIQLPYRNLIGAFSEAPLTENNCNKKGNGFVFVLNDDKIYKIEYKVNGATFMEYNPFYLIFGNSELRLHLNKNEVYSNFGIAQGYFRPKQGPQSILGCPNKYSKFIKYQIHQVFFQISD